MTNNEAFADIILTGVPERRARKFINLDSIRSNYSEEIVGAVTEKEAIQLILEPDKGLNSLCKLFYNRSDIEFCSKKNKIYQLIASCFLYNNRGIALAKMDRKNVPYFYKTNQLELFSGHIGIYDAFESDYIIRESVRHTICRELLEELTLNTNNLNYGDKILTFITNSTATDYKHICLCASLYYDGDLTEIKPNEMKITEIVFIPWENLYLHFEELSQWVIQVLKKSEEIKKPKILKKIFQNINKNLSN